jgi:hypothetical protein
MTSPRLIIETEITQHGRRRPTTLRLDLETCRQAMAELARAERMLLAAAAVADAAADEPAQDTQGSLCWCGHAAPAHNAVLSGGGRGFCTECQPGRCGRYEPAKDAPAQHDPAAAVPGDEPDPADGPAPRHAEPGEPRCEAYDDEEGEGWLCTAQAGHGGPVHLAYADDGTVARRWAAARPQGQDPYGPGAAPPCRCGHPMREHSIRLIDRSRGACTTGCGCSRYQVRPLAAAAAGGAQ